MAMACSFILEKNRDIGVSMPGTAAAQLESAGYLARVPASKGANEERGALFASSHLRCTVPLCGFKYARLLLAKIYLGSSDHARGFAGVHILHKLVDRVGQVES